MDYIATTLLLAVLLRFRGPRREPKDPLAKPRLETQRRSVSLHVIAPVGCPSRSVHPIRTSTVLKIGFMSLMPDPAKKWGDGSARGPKGVAAGL